MSRNVKEVVLNDTQTRIATIGEDFLRWVTGEDLEVPGARVDCDVTNCVTLIQVAARRGPQLERQ